MLQSLVAANPALGREFFMLKNDLKTPYSDQFSFGMRNRLVIGEQDWVTSATLAYIKSEDGIVFLLGNRWPDGTFRTSRHDLGRTAVEQRHSGIRLVLPRAERHGNAAEVVLLSAEKPYTPESGWGDVCVHVHGRIGESLQRGERSMTPTCSTSRTFQRLRLASIDRVAPGIAW